MLKLCNAIRKGLTIVIDDEQYDSDDIMCCTYSVMMHDFYSKYLPWKLANRKPIQAEVVEHLIQTEGHRHHARLEAVAMVLHILRRDRAEWQNKLTSDDGDIDLLVSGYGDEQSITRYEGEQVTHEW
jgi:hypothetical protein